MTRSQREFSVTPPVTFRNLINPRFTATLEILYPNLVGFGLISSLGHVMSYSAAQTGFFNKPYQIVNVFPLCKAKGSDTIVPV